MGRALSEETKEKIRQAKLGKRRAPHSQETKDKLSAMKKNVPLGPRSTQTKKKISATLKEKWSKDAVYRKRMSLANKALWRDPKYARKVLSRRDMSQPEKDMNALIKDLNLSYNFVGNFGFKVGRKYPDFVHTSEKKLIEVYGDYFHKNHDPQDRIDYFKQYGYDCIVIWASELNTSLPLVVEKLTSF